jgi:acid phosphatase type 7
MLQELRLALIPAATWLAAAVLLSCRSARDAGGTSRSTTVDPVEGQPNVTAPRHVPPGHAVVVAAVGDLVQKGSAQRETADLMERLIERRRVAAVLLVGDLQYPRGEYKDFIRHYRHSWGRPSIKSVTRPVPGNHEYNHGKSNARGYFDYFSGPGVAAGQAGVRGVGYYSFEMGDWHFVALNTSDGCRKIECGPGSPMYEWLLRDLAANQRRCSLAYYHHPRYQFGAYHPDTPRIQPIWKALYDNGVDVSVAGHEHNFQALEPLDDEGKLDREHGIHSFVVGTGGGKPYVGSRRSMHPANLRAMRANRYGILLLSLGAGEFEWEFVATTKDGAGEVLERGRGRCHDRPRSDEADASSP